VEEKKAKKKTLIRAGRDIITQEGKIGRAKVSAGVGGNWVEETP